MQRDDELEPPGDHEIGGRLAERREDERRVLLPRRVEVPLDQRVHVPLAPLVARDFELRREDGPHDVVESHGGALARPVDLRERGAVGGHGHRLRLERARLQRGLGGHRLDFVGLAVERLALGGVPFGERVDRVARDVLEGALPERRDQIVLRRELTAGIDQEETEQRAKLVQREPARDVDRADTAGEGVVRHGVERRRRLPDRVAVRLERVRLDPERDEGLLGERLGERLEGGPERALGGGVLPAELPHARKDAVDVAEELARGLHARVGLGDGELLLDPEALDGGDAARLVTGDGAPGAESFAGGTRRDDTSGIPGREGCAGSGAGTGGASRSAPPSCSSSASRTTRCISRASANRFRRSQASALSISATTSSGRSGAIRATEGTGIVAAITSASCSVRPLLIRCPVTSAWIMAPTENMSARPSS